MDREENRKGRGKKVTSPRFEASIGTGRESETSARESFRSVEVTRTTGRIKLRWTSLVLRAWTKDGDSSVFLGNFYIQSTVVTRRV